MADEMMLENEQVEEMTPPQSPAETAPPEGGALESEEPAENLPLEGAQDPGDLGSAPTGAERRQVPAEQADEVSEESEVTDTPEEEEAPPKNWYVVHTYSGYENKVKANIEKAIENRHLEDRIIEVRVPMQDVIEVKNGKRKPVQRKMFPGYVLVNMDMDDETWYVVRNTRGVTGFVGPGSKPVPLSDAEIKPLGIHTTTPTNVDFEVGDTIAVVAGVWKDTTGVVKRMDMGKQTATINVELFGRETPVEISFAEVRKVHR